MAGVFDFLHIKKHTAGSSNELSFDVLEQMSVEADGKAKKKSASKETLPISSSNGAKTPKASKGSFAGVANTTTLSGQAEVEKRKKARHAHRLRVQAAVLVAVVVLVAMGIFAFTRFHEEQADYTDRVTALVDRISAVDDELLEIDALMADPLDEGQAAARTKALADMPKMMTELNKISVDVQTLARAPLDDNAKVVVDQLGKATQARNGMINCAAEAFRTSADAADQVNRANTVWNDVLKADQLAREAIADANKAATQEATSAVIDKTRAALEGIAQARSELAEMSAVYHIDFSAQDAYLAKKAEALEKSIETSEALLAGDRSAATNANDAYNQADSAAAELAEALPPSIGGLVHDQFERNMGELQKRYTEARDRTVEIDSVIRQYLQQQ